jgi:quercetin dioxygenase-like cupin family protein
MKLRQWRVRSRVLLAAVCALIAAAAGAAQQQPPGPATPARGAAPGEGRGQGGTTGAPAGRGNFASNFTGTIAVQQTTGMNMSRIRFEAGARTNWHVHTAGQILLIEEGRGRWQEQGDVVKELPAGQPVYTRANIPHWHGAAPDQHAVQFSVYAGNLTWQQGVTDDEYLGKKR